ncbi:MAG TPA: fimbrial protein [Dyella sp.]|uniref:fimbrial protein n=1 Tax=Dyella sp. TaxID=1869338 RepID=UPI002F958DB4
MSKLLLWLLLLPFASHAQETHDELKWTFTANITGKTCDVETPPPVQLPTLSVGALPSVDSTAGTVKVSLKVKDCDASIAKARFVFLPNPDSLKAEYFTADTGPNSATGVAFRLTSDAGQLIRADGTDNTSDTLVSNSQGELDVFVAYVRTSMTTPQAGDVNGHIEFDVEYP